MLANMDIGVSPWLGACELGKSFPSSLLPDLYHASDLYRYRACFSVTLFLYLGLPDSFVLLVFLVWAEAYLAPSINWSMS